MRKPLALRARLPRRVVAFIRGVLTPARFPSLYTCAPAVAGALDDRIHIYATSDRRFLVEVVPLPSTDENGEPMIEIAIRSHDPHSFGGLARYCICATGVETPVRCGEVTLDEEGLALLRVSLPPTERQPYRIEVHALVAEETEHD